MREVEVGEQQLLLLLGSANSVEETMQSLLVVALNGQFDACFSLWAIVVHHAFGHMHGPLVEQTAHDAFNILETSGIGEFGNLHLTSLVGEIKDCSLAIAEFAWRLLFVVGVRADLCLALNFETTGHSSFVDFAHCAQVVVGNPLPELELWMAQNGPLVEEGHYFFHFISLRLNVVGHYYNCSIVLLSAERYKHTEPCSHTHSRRNAIGVCALHCQRQYYFSELCHRCAKIMFFSFSAKKSCRFYGCGGSSGGSSS